MFPKSIMHTIVAAFLLGTFAPALHAASDDQMSLDKWKTERVANLTSEDGWLTLVGLLWLKEGENTFGRAASNTLVLDHPALPPSLGKFVRQGDKVRFIAAPGSAVTHDGRAVTTLDLTADSVGKPTLLASGSLRLFVIERAGRYGVRIRDVAHPARRSFKGIDYFAVRTDWIVNARFEAYVPVKKIPILNIVGTTDQMESPGALVFEKDGKTWRLDALRNSPDDDELFIIFIDQTSPRESYGAGRYVYTALPKNGLVHVDFNRAYNPPCAFNEFATCPLPPKQNRLALRIEAGEKKYVSH